MAATLTTDTVTEYLASTLGIEVPSFVVSAAVAKVAALDLSVYDDATGTLVANMAASVIAAAGAPRRIQSQGAPSGASRSFTNDAKALSALRRSLASMDTAGVTSAVVGADPASAAFVMVV